MTIFSFGLEWDSISIANKIRDAFNKRNFTGRKGEKVKNTMTMGMTEDGKTAMIVDGFDLKNMFGVSVTLSNDKKEIYIIGGPFSDDASLKAKYNQEFTDLSEASKLFESILKDYDRKITTGIYKK